MQPYIPPYRVPFFRRLAADLHGQLGAELTVAHGSPPPATGCDRDDGTLALEGAVVLSERSWQIGGLPVRVRRLGDLPHRSDVLIVGQALQNLETYPLLARGLSRRARAGCGPALAMWGHGRTYHKEGGPLLRVAKRVLTRQASWFFAYTAGGADHVAAGGFPRDRITVVRNSTDTTALVAARNAVTDAQVAEFASQHGLVPDRTGLYLGGFHASKRIPFLLEAVAHIVKRMPDFRLLVAGDGACRSSVESSAARGDGVVYVGPVHDDRRALLGAASRLMLMPGLVGLCAVDSFALRTPLVTTDWPGHSPEFEYLEHGRNAMVASGGPEQYAEAVVRTLSSPELMARLQRGCVSNSGNYTVEEMSARFAAGVAELLERRPVVTSRG
ncbi:MULTISPECIES: glycosyltransferase family 4 protein [Streptomyces]|uniref:glycosyltransferase family 4 protein n=1 Tax=Streptomyces TaxID=1883 RepID=UPI000BE3FC76|nr:MULTISPECIES: glycosyltransferase family 4 protein [unclassified Streptomyces]NMI58413.1 glycosyltransferase family 4 protein [Streptomyces sp. RLA2-12]QDN57757.1 glycosyltransferase family 4 protein [Streptomyces sp. S1D4-20]QDN67854.1 glycosyltransferase family 4 protein [Streptomyces sp. S1D4-14]QDO20205.1 glycosyltransferase family 4 protein [Streptomyces sp. S1A1-8]QDO30329.1 glycosyltransferase family 4 protein [Streptomyces sp. S1A1-3]